MIFDLVKNRGYKWQTGDNICFKGYFSYLDSDNSVYRGKAAIEELKKINTIEELTEMLKRIDGIFALVIKQESTVLAAVDRARSIPLYFSDNGEFLSDFGDKVVERLGEKAHIDEKQYASLFACGYTIGNETVYSNVKQLDMGEACEFTSDGIKIKTYFYHTAKVSDSDNFTEELTQTAQNAFMRIKAAIAGRPVVLSMSGGYDSRFVGCMLKKMGIEDVSCYTYGKLSSFEVKQSKKNAEALGYRWTCAEYSDEDVNGIIDEIGQEYLQYCNNHDFTAYIQNFAAVRKLHESGWFKPGSVFITGLCGDMPTGSYIIEQNPEMEYNTKTAAQRLFRMIFNRRTLKNELEKEWLENIKKKIEELPLKITDYQSWITAIDAIYTGTCHNRLFLHMNDVHDFFGYEWLLPFWDAELLLKWYSVPAEKRIHQNLYSDWLLEHICKPYGIGQRKKIVSYSKNKMIKKLQHTAGGMICFALFKLGIPFRRKYDFNNFAPLELKLYKNLKSTRWIVYSRAGVALLMNQYVMQKRYPLKYMKEAVKKTKNYKSK